MAKAARPIPADFRVLAPYLVVKGGAAAIDFYKRAFGAREAYRIDMPDGRVGHAELRIGDCNLMLADEFPDMDARGPTHYGGSPVTLHLYVEDVDATFAAALAAGATERRPVKDQFYGDRSGLLVDPFGHVWNIGSRIEDLSPEEITRRAKAAMG